jgi:hypothetical protein
LRNSSNRTSPGWMGGTVRSFIVFASQW